MKRTAAGLSSYKALLLETYLTLLFSSFRGQSGTTCALLLVSPSSAECLATSLVTKEQNDAPGCHISGAPNCQDASDNQLCGRPTHIDCCGLTDNITDHIWRLAGLG